MELVKEKYKQTEIGLIPSDWDYLEFGKLISNLCYGPRFSSKDYSPNGNVKTIRGTDINSLGNILYNQVPIAKLPYQLVCEHKLQDGDLVMITTADCGLTGIYIDDGFNYIASAYAVRITLNADAYPLFFKYVFQTNFAKKQIELYIRKGTLGNLPGSDIYKFKFPIPTSLQEQTEIATALTNADEWIGSIEKLLLKKGKIKQAALQDLFQAKPHWNEVSIASLSKIFTKQTGFDYSSYIKPSLIKKKDNTSIPFIQNKDFKNKWINFDTDYYIPIEVATKFPKILLNEKCLLISISGSVGNVGLFNNKKTAFVGGAVAVAKFKNIDELDWVMYYLLSDKGQNILLSNVKSGSHQNLILDDIRKIKIPIPSIEEQKKLTSILTDMDIEIEQLETKLQKAKKVKQGMMQELLTGKTRLV